MATLRKVRLHLKHKGKIKRICQISFVSIDASLYISPYSKFNTYYYGMDEFPEEKKTIETPFIGQYCTKQTPKLSIHQTGQVHIKGDVGIAGPIKIPSLDNVQGSHVATIFIDRFDVFPNYTGELKQSGKEQDYVLKWIPEVESGRIVLYINSKQKQFPVPCPLVASLSRQSLLKPLYLGIIGYSQSPLTPPNHPVNGMGIISGWDPTEPEEKGKKFLFIRGS